MDLNLLRWLLNFGTSTAVFGLGSSGWIYRHPYFAVPFVFGDTFSGSSVWHGELVRSVARSDAALKYFIWIFFSSGCPLEVRISPFARQCGPLSWFVHAHASLQVFKCRLRPFLQWYRPSSCRYGTECFFCASSTLDTDSPALVWPFAVAKCTPMRLCALWTPIL